MSTQDELRWLESNRIELPERCIVACSWAHCLCGRWSCPRFEYGVEHVAIETAGGVRCRLFDRRLNGRSD